MRALADRSQRASEIGAARVDIQMIDVDRREALADAVDFGPELASQRWQELRSQNGCRAREPRLTLAVGEAHALRDVDQHRDDCIAGARRRQKHDRPHQENYNGRQRERAAGDEHTALDGRQRDERAPILQKRKRPQGRQEHHPEPPGEWMSEVHNQSVVGSP